VNSQPTLPEAEDDGDGDGDENEFEVRAPPCARAPRFAGWARNL
jgi:hypothetical protein